MSKTDSKPWYESEFATLKLGDKRLDKRFLKICADFNSSPQAIIRHAIEDFHQCKAAYRFWQNDQVTSKAMLDAHGDSIKGRANHTSGWILEIQDSSELNFTPHPKTSDLGPIGQGGKLKGLEMHTSLIASEHGVILGVGSCYLWARKPINPNKGKDYRKLDWDDKESIKWARAMEEVDRLGIQNRVIVADREGDIFHLLDKADKEERKFVIRLRWNRKILQSDQKVKEYMQTQPCAGNHTVKISAKGGLYPREERIAQVEVRYADLCYVHQKVSKGKKYELNVSVVYVREVSAPEGEDPLEWYLTTNLSCNTLEGAVRIVRSYESRWLVEEFHKIIKGAMKIEEARLGTGERLNKLIVFLSVFACRLLWISRLSRIEPTLPCTAAFAETEWKFILRRMKKEKEGEEPTILEVVLGVAKLGGYWGRKSDPPPGILVLWRGWMRLQEALEVLDLMQLNIN